MALLKPTLIEGGTNRLYYEGPVAPGDTFDLTAITRYIRREGVFEEQFELYFKALEAGVTNADNVTFVHDADGLPIEAAVEITGTGQARVILEHHHSVGR
jgi:hypothetical protein